MGCSASIDKNQSLPYKNGPASHCIRMDKTYQKQRANIPELVRADSNRDVILANQVKRDLRQREKSIYLDDQEQDTKGSRNLDEPSINEEYYRCPVSGDDEDEEEEDVEDELKESYSMAYECMKYYTGDIVIHVGELMSTTGPILGRDTAPYGRTTSIQFQEYLYTHFHCILQYKLPLNWLHTNQDYLTVWKRSTNTTTIVYGTNNDETDENDHDEEDDDEEEVQYRHIPVEERLPVLNIAAPCVQHLWLS